jgi:hypothetical protein
MFMLTKDWISIFVGVLVFGLSSTAIAGSLDDDADAESLYGDDAELLFETGPLLGEGEFEVTSSRHLQIQTKNPSTVIVITREDIEASGASSIPDILRLVPGMDVRGRYKIRLYLFLIGLGYRLTGGMWGDTMLVLCLYVRE